MKKQIIIQAGVFLFVIVIAVGYSRYQKRKGAEKEAERIEAFYRNLGGLQYTQIDQTGGFFDGVRQKLSKELNQFDNMSKDKLIELVRLFLISFSSGDFESAAEFVGVDDSGKTKIANYTLQEYRNYWEDSKKLSRCFDCLTGVAVEQIQVKSNSEQKKSPNAMFREMVKSDGLMQEIAFFRTGDQEARIMKQAHGKNVMSAIVVLPLSFRWDIRTHHPYGLHVIWSESDNRWYPINIFRGGIGPFNASAKLPL